VARRLPSRQALRKSGVILTWGRRRYEAAARKLRSLRQLLRSCNSQYSSWEAAIPKAAGGKPLRRPEKRTGSVAAAAAVGLKQFSNGRFTWGYQEPQVMASARRISWSRSHGKL
jgi:hypothetical protein